MKSKQTWQQKTVEYRRAAVVEILNRPAGESQQAAIRRIARKYNGRNLPAGKHLRLSPNTLRTIWYRWKKDPSDKAFELHYAPPVTLPQFKPWMVRLFVEYAVFHGLSAIQAHKQISASPEGFPFSLRTVSRHLSAADRARIAKAITLRKKIRIATEELKTITQGETR